MKLSYFIELSDTSKYSAVNMTEFKANCSKIVLAYDWKNEKCRNFKKNRIEWHATCGKMPCK